MEQWNPWKVKQGCCFLWDYFRCIDFVAGKWRITVPWQSASMTLMMLKSGVLLEGPGSWNILLFLFVFFFHFINLSEMRNSGRANVPSFRAQSSNHIAVRRERGKHPLPVFFRSVTGLNEIFHHTQTFVHSIHFFQNKRQHVKLIKCWINDEAEQTLLTAKSVEQKKQTNPTLRVDLLSDYYRAKCNRRHRHLQLWRRFTPDKGPWVITLHWKKKIDSKMAKNLIVTNIETPNKMHLTWEAIFNVSAPSENHYTLFILALTCWSIRQIRIESYFYLFV